MEISRRSFLKHGTAASGVLAAGKIFGEVVRRKPNILVIHTDEQSVWSLGCYGARDIETPNIDSLARDGAIFRNFFCNAAVCTPSRGTMITGLHSRFHGAYGNDIPIDQKCETFAHVLNKKGWKTGYIGKWHLDGSRKRVDAAIKSAGRTGNFYQNPDLYNGWVDPQRGMGFEDNRYMWDDGHWKMVKDQLGGKPDLAVSPVGDEQTYTTDWIAEKTIDFMRENREEPFCVVASIPDPHTPISVRSPYDKLFSPEDVDLPVSMEVPAWFEGRFPERLNVRLQAERAGLATEEYIRQRKATYLGMVKCIDDSVGRILSELESLGLSENTIVIFTSDHGEHMGQAGVTGKAHPYETSYKIPMLIRWPGHIKPGLQVEQLASHVDFKQTVLSLAGVEQHAQQSSHGQNFSPLLYGQKITWDNVVLTQTALHICGLITPKYFLSFFFDNQNKRLTTPVLFDREKDPENISNLAVYPEYADRVRDLWEEMVDRYRALGSPDVSLMQAGYE